MIDKREVCDCHRDCTVLPHECEKPCRWPACLTPEGERELMDELEAEGL